MRILLILLFFLSLFSCTPNVHSKPDYSKTPIFFVHGHGMNAKSWNAMTSYLQDYGYPRQYLRAIQLRPNTGANIEASEKQITPAVESFLESINKFLNKENISVPPKTKVDLISHSMGALSARWYAAKVRPDTVRIWVSLGGAHHGSDVLCNWSDLGAKELCPAFATNQKESLIQYSLNGLPHTGDVDETPYGLGRDSPGVKSIPPDSIHKIIYISIRTSPDRWIQPEKSCILDGAGGISIEIPQGIGAKETSPGNILMLNRVRHDEMLTCPETLKLIKSILDTLTP